MNQKFILNKILFLSVITFSLISSAAEDLFSPDNILPLKIEAPFAQILREAKKLGAGHEADFPQYAAFLSYQNSQGQWIKLPVSLNARGNTSIEECDFAKLEVKFEENNLWSLSPFAKDKKIKIGTHCGDSPAGKPIYTKIGRVKSDEATHREAFIYRLAPALGIVSPRARYAQITYLDTIKKTSIQRKAFLLETHGRLAKRINLNKLEISEETGELDFDPTSVPKTDLAKLYFFENLIGNNDYDFPLAMLDGSFLHRAGQSGSSPYWNIKVFQSPQNKSQSLIVPYDFDLASPVVAKSYVLPKKQVLLFNSFVPLSTDRSRLIWKSLQQLRGFFNLETLLSNQKNLISQRELIDLKLKQAPLSVESKKAFKAHFDAFYEALNHLVDVPLLIHVDAWYNDDLANENSQCLLRSIPPMPAKIIGSAQNNLIKVNVIDIYQSLTDISTWNPCQVPGFVSQGARLSNIVPEAEPIK